MSLPNARTAIGRILVAAECRSFRLVFFACLIGGAAFAGDSSANWTTVSPPCARYSELLKHGHMDLGVRISTSDAKIVSQFVRAMDFWAGVLDMDWHEDDSGNCSIQVVEGGHDLFKAVNEIVAARAQVPGTANFQGVIAFNTQMPLSRTELYMIAVHELGHLFGLQHNPNPMSVMYYMDLEGSESLDASDLTSLAALHKLRVATTLP